jgi:hypothetical protein
VTIVYDSTAGVWTLTNANGLGGTPAWTLLNVPANGPSGRAAFTAVYDPGSNRMMVFGGSGGGTDFHDLWARVALQIAGRQLVGLIVFARLSWLPASEIR